ncbi:MAG TPA: glycosyltransferase family 39 protein, partial [Planctomycetaceae bacterium]|nr:glycosyltransferase family 39 protein [Planctomycetaceae bacterium]
GYLDQFAGDGSAEPYTPTIHARLQGFAIAAGATLLAVFFWLRLRPLTEHVSFVPCTRSSSVLRVAWRTLSANGIAIGSVTLLAAILRLINLSQPIRHDEAYTYMTFARYPWFVGVSVYSDPNNHVFNTLLVNLSTSAFGNGEWAIRLPALLAGIATVPATYVAVRLVAPPLCAVLAAITVATSSVMIEFSTNARGYAIVSLCVALGMIAIPLIARSTRRGKPVHEAWRLLILATTLASWTVPTALYPSIILWTWLLLSVGRAVDRTERRGFLVCYAASAIVTVAATVLLYSPVLLVSGPGSVLANPYVRAMSLEQFVRGIPHELSLVYELLARDCPSVLQGLLLLGLLRFIAGRARTRSGPALLAGLLGMLVLIALQRVLPPARVMQFLVPVVIIIGFSGIAGAFATLNRRRRVVVGIAGIGLCGVWPLLSLFAHNSVLTSEETGVFPEARQVLEHIAASSADRGRAPAKIITIYPVGAPITYTALRYGFDMRMFDRPQGDELPDAVVLSTITYHQSVREVLEGSAAAPPEFADRFCETETFPTVQLYRWCDAWR